MKRLLSLLMVCVLIMGLAACGDSASDTNTTSVSVEEDSGDETAEDSVSVPADPPADSETPVDEDTTELADSSVIESENAQANTVTYPLCEPGDVTITWMDPLMADTLNVIEPDDSQNILWRELEEVTGVHVDFRHENILFFNDKFQLMLAAEDYPDIATAAPDDCASSGDSAYEEDIIVRLNDYEELIPNYLSAIDTFGGGLRNAVTDRGNLLCFLQIYDSLQPNFVGYMVRQNWLDDLGLDAPETIEDWHEMLTLFKNEKTGGAAPLDFPNTGLPNMNWFASAYGLNVNGTTQNFFVQRDGVVACSVTEDAFRDYLETMSAWYREGLIDQDFISGSDSAGAGYSPNYIRLAAGQNGAYSALYSMSGSFFANTGMAEADTFSAMVQQPTLKRGEPNKIGAHGKNASTITDMTGEIIFSNSDHIEEAVAMLDYLYSEEGNLLRTYGVEGETFNYDENGNPVYTDLIVGNPDLAFAIARQVYLRHTGDIFVLAAEEQSATDPYSLTYHDVWNDVGEWNLDGTITFTGDEELERSGLMVDIQTYVSEFAVKTISGMTDLSDESWNTYLDTLTAMNIDRVTEITQEAYNRFLAR